jgi:hypothetical protein
MNGLRWKSSPTIVVGATAAIAVIASLVTGVVLNARTATVDPRVTLDSSRPLDRLPSRATGARQTEVVSAIDGEVARTAERIGEATALALASSLYAATGQINGRAPRGARDLLAGIAAQNLLPPGVTFTQGGSLVSAHGALSVRYRPAPLGVEVVCVGHKPEDGPALIVRIPDELSDKGEPRLFVARSLSDVRIPAPFQPAAEVIALGWSTEILRSLK